MTLRNDFTHVFAVPGASSIIDAINPETGRSMVYGRTLAEVQERDPNAVIMLWEDWRKAQAEKQNTPLRWERTDEHKYYDMLEILPPAAMTGGGFLVGEPTDHSFETGQPRFQAYVERGGRFYASSRPITIAEFRQICGR